MIWKHVQSELTKDYKQLLQRLLDMDYEVKAIIIDGKRGLFKAFKDYPVQMCTARASTPLPSKESYTEIYYYASKIRSW